MARSDAYKTAVESPVTAYLNWSSNDKCFTYWNKETSQMSKVALPVTLIHFDEFATIKGFHDKSNSSIFSNEVKSTKFEELTVRSYKGGELAKGLYADIKAKVNEIGGSYHTSLYALSNGKIINIAMKGAVVQAWSEFTKENRKNFLGNFIEINSSLDAKKGSVKYSVPVFTIGKAIPADVSAKADESYDALVAYFKDRKANAQSQQSDLVAEEIPALVASEAPSQDEFDGLPF